MADIENLKRLAEESKDSGEWFEEGCSLYSYYEKVDADFIVAASPDVVLALIAENEALRADRSAMTSALMRIVDLSNSGHGPMRSYRQMLDIAAEARQVLGLEVANG